jgi:hypothetical protein
MNNPRIAQYVALIAQRIDQEDHQRMDHRMKRIDHQRIDHRMKRMVLLTNE